MKSRLALASFFASLIVALAAVSYFSGSVAKAGPANSQTYACGPGEQQYTAPAGVQSVKVVAIGAQGGTASDLGGGATGGSGGLGARVTAFANVTSGQLLYLDVGCSGTFFGPGDNGGNGGFGTESDDACSFNLVRALPPAAGRGSRLASCSFLSNAGAGGGGAAFVDTVAADPSTSIIVAGGGGGGGGPAQDPEAIAPSAAGGNGGSAGATPTAGSPGTAEIALGGNPGNGGQPGGGGTGGSGGSACSGGNPGNPGVLPTGGDGSDGAVLEGESNVSGGGGGGGAGFAGGGGGSGGCAESVALDATAGGGGGGAGGSGVQGTGFLGSGSITTALFSDVPSVTIIAPPTLTKAFSPTTIGAFGTSTMTLTITNPNPSLPLTGASFTDALSGIQVAASPAGQVICSGGSNNAAALSAAAGGSSVSFSNGTLMPNEVCTITVPVTPTSIGLVTNTSSTAAANESSDARGAPATAQLTVQAAPPAFSKAFSPASILAGGTSTLTFTLTNQNASAALQNVSFSDDLAAAGLAVATAPNTQNNCSGAVITAASGGGSISASNITVPGGATCTLSVDVTAATPGTKNNVSSPVTANNSPVGTMASASLNVVVSTVTMSVHKTFTDARAATVAIALSCSGGTPVNSQVNATSIPDAPAVFTVNLTSISGATCSASEPAPPPGYAGNVAACQGIVLPPGSSMSCTISDDPITHPTTTTLAVAPTPVLLGNPVTLTSTTVDNIAGPTHMAVSAGSVTFKDGATVLGTAPVNAAGMATLTASGLSVGTHTITATFSGTATLAPSSGGATASVIAPTNGGNTLPFVPPGNQISPAPPAGNHS